MEKKCTTVAEGILIVEDHAPTTGLLLELLAAAFPDHSLRSAASAEEALELCRSRLPALAIIDIRLPKASGIAAAGWIKALSRKVRVVIHTSHDDEIYREQSLAAGADAFVSKARTYSDLAPTLRRLLASRP